MPVISAGLLLFRRSLGPDSGGRSTPTALETSTAAAVEAPTSAAVEVFVAHMGGPFWARKREGAWSIPKGEFDEASEDALAAARREFAEEIGVAAPAGEPVDLGSFRYSSGKRLRVFALEAPGFTVDRVASNEFEIEWPPRSGRRQSFPEVDDARWVTLEEARALLVAGQRPVLDALARGLV